MQQYGLNNSTRFRFAPSPTGLLHVGHVASALEVWSLADVLGAQVLLRLEDIDQTRCRPEFEAAILEDLTWLGFEWSGEVRRQSDHMDDYAKALDRLIDRGLCYRCFRTRKEVLADIGRAPHGAPAAFTGAPLSTDEQETLIAAGRPFAWRLNLKRAREILGARWEELSYTAMVLADGDERVKTQIRARPEELGDVILARKDTPTSYHLAATHDDALQRVSHIVRGSDLEASTHAHVLIQTLMDWPTPVYTHHRLLTGQDGKRFAKRDRSQTIADLRARGHSPDDVLQMARL